MDLTSSKEKLESRIDLLSSWMIGFTLPVVVGLFFEFYAIFHLSRTRDFNEFIDRIGLALVTAGVSGELVVEVLIHKKERRLRTVNSGIELEAGRQIEQLKSDRAKLEHATEVMRKQMQPRIVTSKQIDKLRQYLQKSEFYQQKVFILPAVRDVEKSDFALSLQSALNACGWQASFDYGPPKYRPQDPGLVIVATESGWGAAHALKAALNIVDIACIIPLGCDEAGPRKVGYYWELNDGSQVHHPERNEVLVVVNDKPDKLSEIG